MLTEMQDRDAIVANAIEIASAAVRQAYIAGACGNDAALRRQVEERVAAHFQSTSSGKAADAASSGPRSCGPALEHAGINHHAEAGKIQDVRTRDIQRDLANELMEERKMGQKKPRGLMTIWALLLLPATVGGAGMTVWKMRGEAPTEAALQQALDELKQARKAAEEAQKQLEKALSERQAIAAERDEALASEKEAQRTERINREVLDFLQNKLLSASGNPAAWSAEGLGAKVTLKQAVDAAESKLAGAYQDKPLVEASIRQILGSTYQKLGETNRAIQQYKLALGLLQDKLGDDDSITGECRNQLAVVLREAGRHDEASRLFEQNLQNNKKGRQTKPGQNPTRGQSSVPRSTQLLWEDS